MTSMHVRHNAWLGMHGICHRQQNLMLGWLAIKYIANYSWFLWLPRCSLAKFQVVNASISTTTAESWRVAGSLHSRWVAAGQVAAPTFGSVSRRACGDWSSAAVFHHGVGSHIIRVARPHHAERFTFAVSCLALQSVMFNVIHSLRNAKTTIDCSANYAITLIAFCAGKWVATSILTTQEKPNGLTG